MADLCVKNNNRCNRRARLGRWNYILGSWNQLYLLSQYYREKSIKSLELLQNKTEFKSRLGYVEI